MKVEHYVCDYCKEDIPPNSGLRLHRLIVGKLYEAVPKDFYILKEFCGEECFTRHVHELVALVNKNGKEVPNVEINTTGTANYKEEDMQYTLT